MDWTEQTKEQLKKHEGLRLKPYLCSAGKKTIGYGRNLEDNGISEKEAEILLDNDIISHLGEICIKIPFFDRLPDEAKGVLLNMGFNLGVNRLLKFKKFIKALEDEDYSKAAAEMEDSRWYRQVGIRAVELQNIILNLR